jgi:hypothetical protein
VSNLVPDPLLQAWKKFWTKTSCAGTGTGVVSLSMISTQMFNAGGLGETGQDASPGWSRTRVIPLAQPGDSARILAILPT